MWWISIEAIDRDIWYLVFGIKFFLPIDDWADKKKTYSPCHLPDPVLEMLAHLETRLIIRGSKVVFSFSSHMGNEKWADCLFARRQSGGQGEVWKVSYGTHQANVCIKSKKYFYLHLRSSLKRSKKIHEHRRNICSPNYIQNKFFRK